MIYLIIFISDPYTFINAADTVYCTASLPSGPQHEALLQETKNALSDHDPSTCIPLFGDSRNLFQSSVDYHLNTTTSLEIRFSGSGIQCNKFVTVHFEWIDKCLPPGKRQCTFLEQKAKVTTADTECMFMCRTLIAPNNAMQVTFMAQSLQWASDLYKSSRLCDFKITRD